MKFSIPALLGQRHHADNSLSTFQNTYDEQTFVPASKDHELFISPYSPNTPLRSLIKTELARLKGHTADEQRHGPDAAMDKDSESRRQHIWSNIASRYSKAREAIVRRGIQRLFKKNDPDASVIHIDQHHVPTHPVQYRDIDLGYRREAVYGDIVVYLNVDNQFSEFDFGLSTWRYHFPGQDEDLHKEACSGAAAWGLFQHATSRTIRDRSSVASLYEPLPPLSIISEHIQEDSSRPTTSSTGRKDSGEFLRRLQTGSSFGSWLHSRNVSDASEVTLPLSEDYHDSREAPAGENPSMLDRGTEFGAVCSEYNDDSKVVVSQFAHDIDEADQNFVDHGDMAEEIVRLQAPPYLEFEWYEVNNSHAERLVFDTEEPMEASRMNDVDEIHIDHAPQKSHFLHVEQPVDEDDRSFISTYPDDHDASTRTYGVFDAAFAKQVKDYSKLLDDLADPDATAQALELVSSRLSLYLNNNSSADVASGRCAETEAAERRQQMVLPDLCDLDAFIDDDDDDADSGFHVGSTQILACPAKPRPTPFADLEHFISEDDIDLDTHPVSSKKPIIKSFMGWTLSADDEDHVQVSPDRTALRTRPPLRRTC